MTFVYPRLLWFLLALLPLALIFGFVSRRNIRTIRLISGETRGRETATTFIVRYFVLTILFGGALAALIVALAEPAWGEATVEDERRGLELVFLIDVSNSMSAEDVQPSRLARARNTARALAGRLPDAHMAVVIFKGAATVLVPMTEDSVSFELAMSHLSGALVTAAGTNVRDGLETALAAFPPGSPRHRAIILFSDGQELQESVDALAEEIRLAEIPIFAIQTGTVAGAAIPTRSGDIVRDTAGSPVIAGVDEELLQSLAALSGGGYYRSNDSRIIQSVVDDISQHTGEGREIIFRRVPEGRFHLFVLIAVLLLSAVVAVQAIPWGRKRGVE